MCMNITCVRTDRVNLGGLCQRVSSLVLNRAGLKLTTQESRKRACEIASAIGSNGRAPVNSDFGISST